MASSTPSPAFPADAAIQHPAPSMWLARFALACALAVGLFAYARFVEPNWITVTNARSQPLKCPRIPSPLMMLAGSNRDSASAGTNPDKRPVAMTNSGKAQMPPACSAVLAVKSVLVRLV